MSEKSTPPSRHLQRQNMHNLSSSIKNIKLKLMYSARRCVQPLQECQTNRCSSVFQHQIALKKQSADCGKITKGPCECEFLLGPAIESSALIPTQNHTAPVLFPQNG